MTETDRPPMLAGPEDLDLGQLDDLAASSTDAAASEPSDDQIDHDSMREGLAETQDDGPVGDPPPMPEIAVPAPSFRDLLIAVRKRLDGLQGVNEYMTDVDAVADVEKMLGEMTTIHATMLEERDQAAAAASATIADLNEQIDLAIKAFSEEGRKRVETEQALAAREGDLGAARIALAAQHAECEVLRNEREELHASLARTSERLAGVIETSKGFLARAEGAEGKLAALPSWGMWQIEWTKGNQPRTRTLVLAPDMQTALRSIEGDGVRIVGVKAQEQHGVSFKIAANV